MIWYMRDATSLPRGYTVMCNIVAIYNTVH